MSRKDKPKPSHLHPVTAYAKEITAGVTPANKWVRLACKRHLQDLKTGKKRGLYFDEAAADHAISFFPEFLCFYEGAFDGQPFNLTPCQQFIIGSIFGWKRKQDDCRRFRTAYIEMAKGQGKSPLAGGLGLYCLAFDDEPGAEIYAAAVTREQAGILFRDARTFAEKSESLREMLRIDKHNIAYEAENSFFRPVSSEHRGLDGKRPHCVLIDEIHEHPNDLVVRKMSAGMKGRRQGLQFEITNALALDTPIPTPTGWSTMGELKPGDQVFDEAGNVCRVMAATETMTGHECFDVMFDDGSKIIADAGHLWETERAQSGTKRDVWMKEFIVRADEERGNRRHRRKRSSENNEEIFCWCGCGETLLQFDSAGRPRSYIPGHNNRKVEKIGIRTTLEIKNTLSISQKQKNHKVRLAKSLVLPDKDLPIDPYVLGCWLGDGNSKDAALVIFDDDIEIARNIENAGVSVGRRRQVQCSKRLGLYGIGVKGHGRRDSLHCEMKRAGLLKNKHIPHEYLRASYKQRLNLLRGLMDTDGSISPKTGRCVFTQSRHELCLSVAEIVNGLGMKCTMRHSISRLREKDFDRWDVFFYPPWGLDVFGINRKNQHNYPRHSRKRMSGSRMIVDVRPIQSVPVKCIAVNSLSQLFLAGRSMIPTHNSGYDRHSICFEHHDYSEKVLEGIIEDDAWFTLMTGLDVCPRCAGEGKTVPQDGCPDCDDWRDETTWIKANPNLPYLGAPFHDYLRRQVDEAKAMPAQENIVKRLNFCVWTESITRWIPADKWNACAFHVEPEQLRGRICYGGLDLSTNTDVTAWVKVFPPLEEGGRYEVLCKFFLPKANMRERVTRDKVPYDVWERQGFITLTPGGLIDYAFILAQIKQDTEDFDVTELAFDRWGSQKITTDLQDLGFEVKTEASKAQASSATLVQFGQGYASMNAPVKEVETMVLGKTLAHGGNPVLSWMVSNVSLKLDPAGFAKIDKSTSTERVDGAVALVMAIGRAMLRGGPVKSAYDGMSAEEIKDRMSI